MRYFKLCAGCQGTALNKVQCLSSSNLCLHGTPVLGGDTWEEVKTCAQGHTTDTVLFEGGVAGAGTERKEGRGFFLAARHCSQPRRGGRDGRRIFSQGGGRTFV